MVNAKREQLLQILANFKEFRNKEAKTVIVARKVLEEIGETWFTDTAKVEVCGATVLEVDKILISHLTLKEIFSTW